MENWLALIGVILIAYLLGSIPSGLIIGKTFKGIDLRQYGSGKTGATNSLRTLGWKLSLAVFLCDMLKGGLAVFIPRLFFVNNLSESLPPFAPTNPAWDVLPWAVMACSIACVLGHNYSIYIKFTGGRGVAASMGQILAVAPYDLLFMAVFGIPLVVITRYVSLASVTGAITNIIGITGLIVFFGMDARYIGFALAASFLVIIHHVDNIKRLLNGTERKVGEKAKPIAPSSSE
jgi:acyl phosphate:glycerol-3-phosphate acyltransferase